MRAANAIAVICFDVDGTLVEHAEGKTVWQVLNERFLDSTTLNRERLADFRSGRLRYAEWVALDVGDWVCAGVRLPAIEAEIRASLRPVPGARETIATLRRRGYRVAVVSGTIDLTLKLLLGACAFDRVFSNRLFFGSDGAICGWQATVYDMEGKARAVRELAAEFGVGTDACAFVGDHWNDLAALECAGLGVAFCPKDDAVRAAADVVIEEGPLTRLLEIFPEVER
jgi:phosphoserine phosphatase